MTVQPIEPEHNVDLAAVVAAEQALLGALIEGRCNDIEAAQVWQLLAPVDFYRPEHGALAQVLEWAYRHGEPVDPSRLLALLVERDQVRVFTQGGPGPYLSTLLRAAATGPQALVHAQYVYRAARKRDAQVLLARARQALDAPDVDMASWYASLVGIAEVQQRVAAVGISHGIVDLEDFLAEPDPPVDYVLPGLLARGERCIVTGEEGLGKSAWSRQVTICAAAGLHPFTREWCEPRRVLFLDVENAADENRRLLRTLWRLAGEQGRPIARDFFRLPLELKSLDLLSAADVGWLQREVSSYQPDLIYLGPLYQVVSGSLNDEQVAVSVIKTLDRIRNLSDAALLMEAHAGHTRAAGGGREMRPRGSSALLGWPDFGFGLARSDSEEVPPDYRLTDFTPWRGVRKTGRHWPSQFIAGRRWPWEAYPLAGEAQEEAREAAARGAGRW